MDFTDLSNSAAIIFRVAGFIKNGAQHFEPESAKKLFIIFLILLVTIFKETIYNKTSNYYSLMLSMKTEYSLPSF